MFDKSYLKKTGQLWKFYVFFTGFPVVGVSLVFLGFRGKTFDDVNLLAYLVIFGLFLAVSGFILGVRTIKCPKRKVRLLWKAVREQSYQNWFLWLMSLEECPVCEGNLCKDTA